MMIYKKCLLLVTLMFLFFSIDAQPYTYPKGLQTGIPHSDDFTMRVRTKGGEWQETFEYRGKWIWIKVQDASMVQFDMGTAGGNGKKE